MPFDTIVVPVDTEHDISASKPTAALQEQAAGYPDLREREGRARLAKLVVALFDHWALSAADQAALLGLSSGSRSTLARYRRGEPLADSADLISRAGHLLGIHKSLRIIFPHDRDLAYRWIGAPNRRFDGASPLDIIKRYGFEGMLAVRRYLDFERGR